MKWFDTPIVRAFNRMFRHSNFFIILVICLLTAFLVWPVLYIIAQAFWSDGGFSWVYVTLLFESEVLRESLGNSLWLAILTTIGCCVISIPLAFLFARYEFKGKMALQGLLIVPLILPPFVGALGLQVWLRKYGPINLTLMGLGIIDEPIDFLGGGGFLGIVWVQVLHLYPILFLNLLASLFHIDPTLEEAGVSLGASRFRLFRTVMMPLVRPGFVAGAGIVFIWALTDLGAPLMFNYPFLLPVQIYNMINDLNANPMGYVLVVVLLALTATFFLATRLGNRSVAMTHKGQVRRVPKPVHGLKKWTILGFIIFTCGFALMPHVGVFLNSIAEKWSMTILPAEVTFGVYQELLLDPLAMNAIKISLVLSVFSTVIDIFFGVGIGYVLTRKTFKGRVLFDVLMMMPLALPGIILAFGYVATFSGSWLDPRYNPLPLLVIAYAVRRLPYMVRSAVAGFEQSPVVLEEASYSLGAGMIRTYTKILFPLIIANVVAGGLLCFAYAMLEVSNSIVLAMKESFYPIAKAIYMFISLGNNMASAMGVVGTVVLAFALWGANKALGGRLGRLFKLGV